MERKRVESSNISSIGYSVSSRLLEIEFKNDSIYEFSGVPEEVYIKLMKSASHGSFFHANIRDKYPTRRIK